MDDLKSLLVEVRHNLDSDLDLERLARASGLSPFHFHRTFSGAVGETPKQHVDRVRLERAAYLLAVTTQSVIDIALTVGFRNPETFTRAFRKRFRLNPIQYRRAAQAMQAARVERMRGFRGDGCVLSDVVFTTMPATWLLTLRRIGPYMTAPIPFTPEDALWAALVAWTRARSVKHTPLAWVISYDDPTVTPPAAQHLDACIPLATQVKADAPFKCIRFEGGSYAGIAHNGPHETIDQAYRTLADGIRRSERHAFREGPPIQIYRTLSDAPAGNQTEVYFPVAAKS